MAKKKKGVPTHTLVVTPEMERAWWPAGADEAMKIWLKFMKEGDVGLKATMKPLDGLRHK